MDAYQLLADCVVKKGKSTQEGKIVMRFTIQQVPILFLGLSASADSALVLPRYIDTSIYRDITICDTRRYAPMLYRLYNVNYMGFPPRCTCQVVKCLASLC